MSLFGPNKTFPHLHLAASLLSTIPKHPVWITFLLAISLKLLGICEHSFIPYIYVLCKSWDNLHPNRKASQSVYPIRPIFQLFFLLFVASWFISIWMGNSHSVHWRDSPELLLFTCSTWFKLFNYITDAMNIHMLHSSFDEWIRLFYVPKLAKC